VVQRLGLGLGCGVGNTVKQKGSMNITLLKRRRSHSNSRGKVDEQYLRRNNSGMVAADAMSPSLSTSSKFESLLKHKW
jgi:hypothetical protein